MNLDLTMNFDLTKQILVKTNSLILSKTALIMLLVYFYNYYE